MLKMLKNQRGESNVITMLITFPIALFLVTFIVALQQHFYILNSVNDAANTALDIALTQGGLNDELEDTIKSIIHKYGLKESNLSITSYSNDPDNPEGIYYDDDNFVKRGYVISLQLEYTANSMINSVSKLLAYPSDDALNKFYVTVSGMSQRWSRIESEESP